MICLSKTITAIRVGAFCGIIASTFVSGNQAVAAGDLNSAPDTVILFKDVPTPEDLLRVLYPKVTRGGGTEMPHVKTRSIVFTAPERADAKPAPTAGKQTAQQGHPKGATATGNKPGRLALAYMLNFDKNDARLKPDAVLFVQSIGKAMQAAPDLEIVLSGHADASGSDAVNNPLSMARAVSVASYLQRQFGIKPGRIVLVGHGSYQPLPGYDPYDPMNRRVQVMRRL